MKLHRQKKVKSCDDLKPGMILSPPLSPMQPTLPNGMAPLKLDKLGHSPRPEPRNDKLSFNHLRCAYLSPPGPGCLRRVGRAAREQGVLSGTVNCQPLTVNCQLMAVNLQPPQPPTVVSC